MQFAQQSAQYTAPPGEIVLSLEATQGQARLRVSDNGSGSGIAPSLLPHVFELFTQAERTPDRAQGGLGLGLALVKHIVALHGGAVEAQSEGPGKGSVFTITLALVKEPPEMTTRGTDATPAEQQGAK